MDDASLPTWAARLRAERAARGWSQRDAVRNLPSYAPTRSDGHLAELPDERSLLRQWKGWEAGAHRPSDDFYAPMIARMFGTVTAALFPPEPATDSGLLAATGLNTLELVSRMRASALDPATLDALAITADRLCSEYPYMPASRLRMEGEQWLRRLLELTREQLTLAQHRESCRCPV